MSSKDSVFLVTDNRFGVVFASLSVDEAMADLNKRALTEATCGTLSNPGSFRIKSVKLGSQDTLINSTEDVSAESAPPYDDHAAAIARDIQLGRSSQKIRDEIIAKVGMMAAARTPEMQARYDAAVKRERNPRGETAGAEHGSMPFLTDHQRYSLRCLRDFARPRLATTALDDQNRCDLGLSWLDDLLDGTGMTTARENRGTLSTAQRQLLIQFQEACRIIGAHDDGSCWQMLSCAIEAELAALDLDVTPRPLHVETGTASRTWHQAELEKYLARPDAGRGAAGTEDALRALLAVGAHDLMDQS